jgi:phosphatidylglycerophosphate synthase
VSLAGATGLPFIASLLVGAVPQALLLALTAYLVAAVLAAGLMNRSYPYADLGLANLVTLTRLLLTSALLAPLAAPAPVESVLAVAIVVLALDGIDGWLARRQGRESAFGARFDMEVDAFLGLVLAFNAWASGTIGPVVLLLALPRYVFAAAGYLQPWMARALPERFGRKVVCVVQITALIALQLPSLAGTPALSIAAAALTALAWSFGRDVLWLWRTRT